MWSRQDKKYTQVMVETVHLKDLREVSRMDKRSMSDEVEYLILQRKKAQETEDRIEQQKQSMVITAK